MPSTPKPEPNPIRFDQQRIIIEVLGGCIISQDPANCYVPGTK
jgi:hypothetical protein